MKIKSLAILAMSGLAAASFAYMTPAFADDMNSDDQTAQSSDDSSSNQADTQSNSDNGSTADTATGDED
jgi:hypothetical protein